MSITVPKLTEADMLKGIKFVAKQFGYLVFHNTYAIGSDRGFPDLVIVGYGCTWFLELKGPKPRISDEQKEWIQALYSAGNNAQFVHPGDYGVILAELQQGYENWRKA